MSVKHMAQETAIFSRRYRKTAPNKVNRIAGEVKTEMNLVERVASALKDSGINFGTMTFSTTPEDAARAAIAEMLDAMGEPSEGMIEAGFRARSNDMTMAESAAATWQAMLAQFKAENIDRPR